MLGPLGQLLAHPALPGHTGPRHTLGQVGNILGLGPSSPQTMTPGRRWGQLSLPGQLLDRLSQPRTHWEAESIRVPLVTHIPLPQP